MTDLFLRCEGFNPLDMTAQHKATVTAMHLPAAYASIYCIH